VGASIGFLLPLGAKLSLGHGCALDVGACNRDGDADGEVVEVVASLGVLLPIRAVL